MRGGRVILNSQTVAVEVAVDKQQAEAKQPASNRKPQSALEPAGSGHKKPQEVSAGMVGFHEDSAALLPDLLVREGGLI